MAYASPLPDLQADQAAPLPRAFAWTVFALTFGLLISDYMSRQVLNAVFPLLKLEWQLSDARLGLLSGIVALMVGLLTFPLSLLADRWGRVKSLVLMAALWSLATLGCALARDYQQMFVARFLVGVGEAAYGSVGIAVVLSVFPRNMRATLSGAFMAGGMFGSVLGMALGGAIAAQVGWRWAFAAMALFGLVLAAVYPLVVRPARMGRAGARAAAAARPPLAHLFRGRALRAAYVGSGLQLFAGGACIVWMPSFLNRYYGLDAGRAGAGAAVLVLAAGAGMILCGMLSDRMARVQPVRKVSLAAAYGLASAVLLGSGLLLPPGVLQLALIGCGMFFAAGASGPAGAMVANLTPDSMHGTAFATLTLANNLIGLAPGPFITGALADRLGLGHAFLVAPLASLAAACVFLHARRFYESEAIAQGGAA
ncbi:multidrug DMT transporter permease [Massilia sp. Root351]|uniref:MFS transporter n=1 Tax=Massilia sp. Root351 TaxID=1736522 RepID=UPI000708E882|nr:MFS transporter [Massilia sp. Root351]KQV82215.1 multidrug DMT transporter permease [Massilia sp. Root351]